MMRAKIRLDSAQAGCVAGWCGMDTVEVTSNFNVVFFLVLKLFQYYQIQQLPLGQRGGDGPLRLLVFMAASRGQDEHRWSLLLGRSLLGRRTQEASSPRVAEASRAAADSS